LQLQRGTCPSVMTGSWRGFAILARHLPALRPPLIYRGTANRRKEERIGKKRKGEGKDGRREIETNTREAKRGEQMQTLFATRFWAV
jgi:hypothetical protein